MMIYMYKNIVNLKRSLLKIVLIMNVTGVLVFFQTHIGKFEIRNLNEDVILP